MALLNAIGSFLTALGYLIINFLANGVVPSFHSLVQGFGVLMK